MRSLTAVVALALAAVLVPVESAQADPVLVVYSFRDLDDTTSAPSFEFPADGLFTVVIPPLLTPAEVPTIEATGEARPFSALGFTTTPTTVEVTQSPFGLGVGWDGIRTHPIIPPAPTSDIAPEIVGSNESLILTFDDFANVSDVTLVVAGITLSESADAVVHLNGTEIYSGPLPDAFFLPGPLFLFEPLEPGDVLKITPTGTFDTLAVSGLVLYAQVPEPSSMALILVGIGALGYRARRRRS